MKQIDEFAFEVIERFMRHANTHITEREPTAKLIEEYCSKLEQLIRDCCEKQKKECADNAMIGFDNEGYICVKKDSILNCKNVVDG